MKPLFTIIMPNYNKEPYIAEAINSVLQQTYTNWEMIIIDDCSTDNSLSIINEYVKQYSNISVISNKKNRGISYNMNKGCKAAKGEIIGTLDSDDILEPYALEYMVDLHEKNPSYSLIVSTISLNDKDMNFIGIEESLPLLKKGEELFDKRRETIEVYLKEHKVKFISMSFRTFKKSAYDKVKGYDTSLRTAEDVDIMYQLEKVGEVMFTGDPIYKRRVYSTSITNFVSPISLYCDYFRAECKEIKRKYHRFIPFCGIKNAPDLMILYYNIWFRRYRPGSDLFLADAFIKAGYSYRKTNKKKSSFYFKIAQRLRTSGK